MNEENIKNYYNKFNEDKRLNSRHGIVEFNTTMYYIKKYLKKYNNPKIIDIGAGTGKYTLELNKQGYDITAVELVKHNLKVIEKKNKNIPLYLANATNLKVFEDNSFDIVLLFGPLYHLITEEEKLKALNEAKRICKKNGLIFISYYMNNYAVLKHGFIDNNILNAKKNNQINNKFEVLSSPNDLYSYATLKQINKLNKACNLKRVNIISQDGPTDYMRKIINNMDNKTFELYKEYIIEKSIEKSLLGYSSHLLDIIKKDK